MPRDHETRSDGGHNQESSILSTASLFVLPLLSFQRKILGLAKTGIETAIKQKPIQTLLLSEIHALLMIMDPEHRLRNQFGADLEEKLKALLDEVSKRVASGSLELIEAQETLSNHISGILMTLKEGQKRKRAGRA